MIIDTLKNLEKYVSLNALFSEVVAFIKTNDLNKLEDGKHIIKGSDLFLNVLTTAGKTQEEAVFETHRNMIDIQIPLDNDEGYGYMPLQDMPAAEYNETKDVSKYPGLQSNNVVWCKPGEFAMFFPQDGHQPCIGKGNIRKAIFKIKA